MMDTAMRSSAIPPSAAPRTADIRGSLPSASSGAVPASPPAAALVGDVAAKLKAFLQNGEFDKRKKMLRLCVQQGRSIGGMQLEAESVEAAIREAERADRAAPATQAAPSPLSVAAAVTAVASPARALEAPEAKEPSWDAKGAWWDHEEGREAWDAKSEDWRASQWSSGAVDDVTWEGSTWKGEDKVEAAPSHGDVDKESEIVERQVPVGGCFDGPSDGTGGASPEGAPEVIHSDCVEVEDPLVNKLVQYLQNYKDTDKAMAILRNPQSAMPAAIVEAAITRYERSVAFGSFQ